MSRPTFLFEDNHLLAVAKPSGVPVQASDTHPDSLLDQLKHYRKTNEGKPGEVFVGLVHRLDLPVSGVMVFAKTSKAASRLSEQFRNGTVRKTYLAMVEAGSIKETSGVWADELFEDETTGRVTALAKPRSGSKPAETEWKLISRSGGTALLELHPRTGRRHQLRVQCSVRGFPILGDRKYGSQTVVDGWIALHAWKLQFEHPTKRTPVEIGCDPPDRWKRYRLHQ